MLTVYARLYCHLCEELLGRLEALRAELDFQYQVVDVDEEPSLTARYNDLVPVLAAGEREICHHFLDETALRHYLAQA